LARETVKAVEHLQVPDDMEEVLREAAKHPLTRDEIREQRISFVMGMMPEGSTLTREEIKELIDNLDG
jgi:hypothetical protein